jgi:integrase
MTTRRRRRAEKEGIRWRRGKWQAYVKVDGKQYPKTFPALATFEEMQQWRRDEIKRRSGADVAPLAGSFADDVAIYLKRIAAKRTATQIGAHLALWLQALGRDRPSGSITTDEIAAVLTTWQTEPAPLPSVTTGRRGRPPVDAGRRLNVETIRKRRTSLQSFFTVMRPAQLNPAKGAGHVPPRSTNDEPRSLAFAVVERVLAAMPTYRDTPRGALPALSLAKLRATVIAYTGLPPGMLAQVTRADLDLRAGTLRVVPRRKGRGVGAQTLHPNEDALAALTAFDAADAYGSFAAEALNRSFKKAAKRIDLDPRAVHLYDLRHSYLTELYRVTRDEATVARAALHAAGSPMTARYTRGAHADVDRAAQVAFSAALAAQRKVSKVSAKGVRRSNIRKIS